MATPKLPPITALSPIDVELRKLWDDAQGEFRKNTKKELRADPHKRLEDVLQELERKYQPKDLEEASTKKKIGETINKILKCVQMLGGLAAQGASIVFGPATLCFNAISFLIDVPGRIAAVYEGIGNLFEEVSHVLVLFHVYRDYKKFDPELKDGTHKLMVSFVRICGLSIKIIDGGTWHHIKVGAKVTFLKDDSGVKDELDNFKALIDKQSHFTEAITLKHVLDSEASIVDILENQYLSAEQQNRMETGINVLVADASDKKTERITSERVDTIAKTLSVPRDSAQVAKQALQDIRGHLLQGSLQWLLDLDAYKEWVTPVTKSIPLLLLSGDPNTGKSSLVAFIDKDLRSRNIPNVAIAYYAFTGRDAKSTRDKNKDDIVSAALKSMAVQLATQNKAYAKDLSGLKESDLKLPETHKEFPERHLWDKLQFSKDPQSQDPLNLILLFDGLDQLPESHTSKFLDLLVDESRSPAKTDRLRLRILATGKNQRGGENINNIQIVDYNEDDIKLYIERELNKDEDLQGQHVEMPDLLKSIREKLLGVASGSFSIVDQKLARIREAVDSDAYSDDLTAIIEENPSEDPDKLAQKEQLKANDRAFALYEEVLEVNSQEHQTRCNLINALYKQNKEEDARNMLIQIKDQPDKEIGLKKFSEFLREITGIDDYNLPLNNIVMLAQTDKDFNQAMLEALQSAINEVRKNRMAVKQGVLKQGVLLLYYGIVLARGTADDDRLQRAVYSWEDCQPLFLVSRYELMETYYLAIRYRAQYYFQQATKQGASPQDVEQHFSKLIKITHSATSLWSGFRLCSFLASYYVHRGQVDNAQKLLMEDMLVALEILSDGDPDNDSHGYKILANILMHTGDDLNALSAWSLLGPNDTYSNSSTPPGNSDKTAVNNNEEETSPSRNREGPLTYFCDGRCGHTWTYANDMYICRYCPDTQFTGDCLEKVKSNKLERYICHPDHSWLHVPAWSNAEALEVGKGRVRVHGELVDGKRVGGDTVDVDVWIDEIRVKWGLPKKAVEEPESEPIEEREVLI
ncbi:hypothetical protein EG329_005702 [Mollisiaceae sp. DMI_Dod_QoI]|nr:hypothetical protein EG329_005702 [Helotiales sp. DMI_Dod_QoI]